jgi:hypothetical protein
MQTPSRLHVSLFGHDAAQTLLEQQPPLHPATALHDVEQENPLHAIPVGQSPDVRQLHAPEPHVPELQQNSEPQVPSVAPPQALVQVPVAQVGVPSLHASHAPPDVPHAPLSNPVRHISPSQHPPLHVRPPTHAAEQTCVTLHAFPSGQSVAAFEQPHSVPMQADPSVDDVQSTQFPPAPQLVCVPRHPPPDVASTSVDES